MKLLPPFIVSLGLLFLFFYISGIWIPVNAQEPIPDETPIPVLQPHSFENFDVVIVRVYYGSEDTLNKIAGRMEPWEVNKDQGYLIVDVNTDAYNWLIKMGLRVEVEDQLTQLYNSPAEITAEQISGIPNYSCYRTVGETFVFAETLVSSYPNFVDWIDIGDSWEKTHSSTSGHDIKVLRITNKATSITKPKLFVMSGLHAREYAPVEINNYFAEYLLENYGIDPDITWLLDYHEIHLLLHANPDGRVKAENGLYWRKNTNQNYCSPTSNYRGADLNRNFDFKWNYCPEGYCSSSNQCYETYRGPSAASEPETQAVQNYLLSIFPDQRADDITSAAPITTTGVFIDLHSYGEQVLWPWGFTTDAPPNSDGLDTLGKKLSYYNSYSPDQASTGLYLTDGDSDGYAYGELGIAGYTFEVGTTFFEPCTNFLNNIIPGNIPALIYAAKISRYPYMFSYGPDSIKLSASPLSVSTGETFTLQATINDKRLGGEGGLSQNVSAAEYYIDIPPWITTTLPVSFPMAADDSVFDEKIENVTATVDSTGLQQGRHMLFVRGQDADGNWGPVSAVFFYVYDESIYFPLIFAP